MMLVDGFIAGTVPFILCINGRAHDQSRRSMRRAGVHLTPGMNSLMMLFILYTDGSAPKHARGPMESSGHSRPRKMYLSMFLLADWPKYRYSSAQSECARSPDQDECRCWYALWCINLLLGAACGRN